MATYTITLEELSEFHDIEKVALREYPIFDEGYRLPLNKKILDRYWFREIGYETPNMFFFHLKRHMNEVMPYFNQLYKTEQIKYDPLSTVSMSTISESNDERENTNESDSTNSALSNSKAQSLESTTPQTQLSGHENYANSLSESTSEGTSSGTGRDVSSGMSKGAGLAQSLVEGRSATGASLVMEYRQTLLNIDVMVLDSINTHFMSVWNNNDIMPSYPRFIQGPFTGWGY